MDEIKLTKTPKAIESYLKREKYVEDAIHSNALNRVLFLLIDSKPNERYNDALAKRYYDTSDSTKLANPKVIAIYLRKLRDAQIIKRVEKQGKFQLYDVDWNGLFDIIRFRKFLTLNPNKADHTMAYRKGMFYSFIIHGYKDEKCEFKTVLEACFSSYPEPETERLSNELVEKYFKPYFERTMQYYKKYRSELPVDENGEPFIPEDTFEPPKNFETIDFDIYHVLNKFDRTFFSDFPTVFQPDIEQLFKNNKINQASNLTKFLLRNYGRVYQKRFDRGEYYSSSQPEYVLLESFNREIKKLDFQIIQYDDDQRFKDMGSNHGNVHR